MFDDPNGQMEASFGIALFCCGPAVRGLEPKERHDSCPLAGDYMTMYLGILTVLWVYPHSHVCMDGCMYVCMDGWMDACMYVWMDGCMYVCMMDGWMDACMYV